MTAEQILTGAMTLGSVVMFAALLVSWAELGRTRHSLCWAAAFGVAALQWVLMSIQTVAGHDRVVFALICAANVLSTVLLFGGFRARARLPEHLRPLLALVGGVALVAFLLDQPPARNLAWALPQLVRVVLMPMAAYYLLARPATTRAERVAGITLVIWATSSLCVAIGRLADTNWSAGWPQFLAGAVVPTTFVAVGLGAVLLLASDLAGDLRRLAVKDPLTNVLNRRGFDEAAANVIASEARRNESVCLVLADIDHFKELNDRHGHIAGDRALVKVASCLAAEIRRGDVIGRIGGEEFAILLAPCKGPMARRIVERMRRSIEALDVGLPQGQRLTTSFGVVELERSAAFDKGLRRADEALYASKQAGRNRVTLAA